MKMDLMMAVGTALNCHLEIQFHHWWACLRKMVHWTKKVIQKVSEMALNFHLEVQMEHC